MKILLRNLWKSSFVQALLIFAIACMIAAVAVAAHVAVRPQPKIYKIIVGSRNYQYCDDYKWDGPHLFLFGCKGTDKDSIIYNATNITIKEQDE